MLWKTAIAIVAGMSLIGWAVDDVLPWIERTALIFGVVLVAGGMASGVPRSEP